MAGGLQRRAEVGGERDGHDVVRLAVEEQHGHLGPQVGVDDRVGGVPLARCLVDRGSEERVGGIRELPDVVGPGEPDERVGRDDGVLAVGREPVGRQGRHRGEVRAGGVSEEHQPVRVDAGLTGRRGTVGERAEDVLDGDGIDDVVRGGADRDGHRDDTVRSQRFGQRLETGRVGRLPGPAGDHHDDGRRAGALGHVWVRLEPWQVLVRRQARHSGGARALPVVARVRPGTARSEGEHRHRHGGASPPCAPWSVACRRHGPSMGPRRGAVESPGDDGARSPVLSCLRR